MTIFGIEISDKIYLPIFIILGAYVIDMIINKILSLRIIVNKKLTKHEQRSRKTVLMMCKNIIKVLIAIIAILYILQVYGVNTSALVAGVGAFSLVIGLAFQDILKDLLAGISIIFDNKFSVGDLVMINGFTGTVIELGLRTTKIRSASGEVKSISNSSFSEVVNYNLSNTDLFIKLNVAYDTKLDKLEKILESIREDVLKIEESEAKELLFELKHDYEDESRGLRIDFLGNRFKLTTKYEHREYYQKLLENPETNTLSQAALETLAIIAYNEPVTRIQVDSMRGVGSTQIIRKLVAKGFIKEVGRSDLPGRPILYETTSEFLDYFGLSTIDDLPDMNSFIEESEKEDSDEADLYTSKYKEEVEV